MNRIFNCFKEKKCNLDKLYVCKIFRTNSDEDAIEVKILCVQNSIEENCYFDPISGTVYFTLYYANFSKDEFYCEVLAPLVQSMSGTPISAIFQKGKLNTEQIKELNNMISDTHNMIKSKSSEQN